MNLHCMCQYIVQYSTVQSYLLFSRLEQTQQNDDFENPHPEKKERESPPCIQILGTPLAASIYHFNPHSKDGIHLPEHEKC